MLNLKVKVKNLYNNLHLKKTLLLVWRISPAQSIFTLLFLLLENISWIGTIYTLKLLIDKLVGLPAKHSSNEVVFSILLAGIVAVLYACIKGFSAYLNERQAAVVNYAIDKQIHEHSIRLDYSCYENPVYLDMLKRAREAGVDRPYAVISGLYEVGRNVFMLASIGYILITIDWKLLPLLGVFVAPVLLIRIKFSEKLYWWQKKNTGLEREANYLSSLLTGDIAAKEIRTFSLGSHLLSRYQEIKYRLLDYQLTHNRKRTLVELISTVAATASFFTVTGYIVLGVIKGKTTVGDIAAFLVVFPQSFSIMQGLAGGISRLYQNNRYLADVFSLFNVKPVIESSVFSCSAIEHDINDFVVDNLSFKYPHSQHYVLENISLSIRPGQVIGLVGLNGAGKSTLIKLLCRLYDPVEGGIRIGDKDIREMDVNDYRSRVSVVFQDFVRYNMTATENIRFGNIHSPVNTGELKRAAEDAGVSGYIKEFPNQYDTILGRIFENGQEISMGQWQKLAIARALYSKSKLVIMDEATSALDTIAEQELFTNLKQKLGNRSALVISHRLSTIQQADLIYVMGDRKIIECGTHDRLLESNGVYAAMFKS